MRNDTRATAGEPLQTAPLIVFEAHGYVGGVDHLWEMNENSSRDLSLAAAPRLPGNSQRTRGPTWTSKRVDSDGNYWGRRDCVCTVGGFVMIDNLTGAMIATVGRLTAI